MTANIILIADGKVLKELPLTKERVTIGRKRHNDMVVNHMSISGEHAVIVARGEDFFLEDLDSTNGTQVNGKSIEKYCLQDNDVIDLAPYQITFVAKATDITCANTPDNSLPESSERMSAALSVTHHDNAWQDAVIHVLTGTSAGSEMLLSKPLTTIGQPGFQVAAIARGEQGYLVSHIEGESFPLVNGVSIGTLAHSLQYDDVIELSGTQVVLQRKKP